MNDTTNIESESEYCIICLTDVDEFQKLEALDCECKMIYHEACMTKWLMLKNKCPICSKIINKSNIDVTHFEIMNRIYQMERMHSCLYFMVGFYVVAVVVIVFTVMFCDCIIKI